MSLIPDEVFEQVARMVDGPHLDPSTGLVSGEIGLPGGLPPEPDDGDPNASDPEPTA